MKSQLILIMVNFCKAKLSSIHVVNVQRVVLVYK